MQDTSGAYYYTWGLSGNGGGGGGVGAESPSSSSSSNGGNDENESDSASSHPFSLGTTNYNQFNAFSSSSTSTQRPGSAGGSTSFGSSAAGTPAISSNGNGSKTKGNKVSASASGGKKKSSKENTNTNTGAQMMGNGGNGNGEQGKGGGRKKVAKACLACQKSHLTCDEQRPCTRCVKKGTADQCVEGVRKKAKYLLEGEERVAARTHQPSPSPPPAQQQQQQQQQIYNVQNMNLEPGGQSNIAIPIDQSQQQQQPRISDDLWLSTPLQTDTLLTGNGNGTTNISEQQIWSTQPVSVSIQQSQSQGQGSQLPSLPYNTSAANNEYQMLDAMFASLSPIFPGLDSLDEAGRQLLLDGNNTTTNNNNNIGNMGLNQQTWNNNGNTPSMSMSVSSGTPASFIPFQQTPISNPTTVSPGTAPGTVGTFGSTSDVSPNNTWANWQNTSMNTNDSNLILELQGQGRVQDDRIMPSELRRVGKGLTSAEVYKTVVRPFDYTQGYHVLISYLQNNFEQSDVLRVVRALASFRPSLIALQMPMTEDDEVFLERSFQRTLIELEKLISYSATPTAVWRRTGEVCYANPEFCKLLSRTDADLLGKKTYVYELFNKKSVVGYWENFSVHAFENTTQNFFQSTTLLRGADSGAGVGDGQGQELSCTGCFTIRRDVFDLPSVVIGQFLPIPTDNL